MNEKVKYAMLGVKHPHAAHHVRTLQLMDEVESIVLVDEDTEAVQELRAANSEKIEEQTLSFNQVLEREDVGLVFGCLTNDENGPAMLRAVQGGKHVMSEKPVGISSEIIAEVVEAARANGVVFSVCYQNRYHPIPQDIRRLVAEGVIGRVLNVEVRMVTSQVKFRNPDHWLFKREKSGGGILSWLMCHYFDLLAYMLQDDIAEVTAVVDTLNGFPIDVEDTASGTLRLSSGAIGAFNAGYLLTQSPSGYSGATYDTYIGIKGLEGSLAWLDDGPKLRIQSTADGWNTFSPVRTIEYDIDQGEGYGGEMGKSFQQQFVRAVLYNEEPPTRGEDALKVARIIEACYHSSETGQRVELE